MSLTQKYFSFAEIVQGRDASVRVSDDGLLNAVDLARVVTGEKVYLSSIKRRLSTLKICLRE